MGEGDIKVFARLPTYNPFVGTFHHAPSAGNRGAVYFSNDIVGVSELEERKKFRNHPLTGIFHALPGYYDPLHGLKQFRNNSNSSDCSDASSEEDDEPRALIAVDLTDDETTCLRPSLTKSRTTTHHKSTSRIIPSTPSELDFSRVRCFSDSDVDVCSTTSSSGSKRIHSQSNLSNVVNPTDPVAPRKKKYISTHKEELPTSPSVKSATRQRSSTIEGRSSFDSDTSGLENEYEYYDYIKEVFGEQKLLHEQYDSQHHHNASNNSSFASTQSTESSSEQNYPFISVSSSNNDSTTTCSSPTTSSSNSLNNNNSTVATYHYPLSKLKNMDDGYVSTGKGIYRKYGYKSLSNQHLHHHHSHHHNNNTNDSNLHSHTKYSPIDHIEMDEYEQTAPKLPSNPFIARRLMNNDTQTIRVMAMNRSIPRLPDDVLVQNPLQSAHNSNNNAVLELPKPYFIHEQAVTEQYELIGEDQLGDGSYAVVKPGRRRDTKVDVAIKQVHKRFLINEEAQNAVKREVEIHLRLKHHNIVQLYEVYETDAFLYLVMAKAQDGNLKQLLEMKRKLSEKNVAKLAQQILCGIFFLHESGILHCDLKPANILLSKESSVPAITTTIHNNTQFQNSSISDHRNSFSSSSSSQSSHSSSNSNQFSSSSSSHQTNRQSKSNQDTNDISSLSTTGSTTAATSTTPTNPNELGMYHVQLCDFGLSVKVPDVKYFKYTGDVHKVPYNGLIGTSGYMAPELFQEHPYGKPVDMWSVGIIIYEMLCGYGPFYPPSACVYEAVDFHPRVWDKFSKECKDLVEHLLEKDPAKRYTAEQALSHPWFDTSAFAK